MKTYTNTREVDEIELTIQVGTRTGAKLYQTAPATVAVHFTFEPGYAAVIAADPNDSEEGCSDEVEIDKVIAAHSFLIEGERMRLEIDAGCDITALLSVDQIDRLTESLAPEVV